MYALFRSVVVIATLSLLTTSATAQNIAKTDFDEFCKIFTGRWIGEVTWVTDWPGIGKKGDTATCYLDINPIENGNAMIGKFYGGLASGTVLWAYSTGEWRITATVVYSSGLVEHLVYTKEDGDWIETVSGTLPDGRKTKSRSTITIEEDGDVFRAQGNGTVDGKPTDPRDDKWQRLNKWASQRMNPNWSTEVAVVATKRLWGGTILSRGLFVHNDDIRRPPRNLYRGGDNNNRLMLPPEFEVSILASVLQTLARFEGGYA